MNIWRYKVVKQKKQVLTGELIGLQKFLRRSP